MGRGRGREREPATQKNYLLFSITTAYSAFAFEAEYLTNVERSHTPKAAVTATNIH